MIRVSIERNQDGKIDAFSMEGHADFAPHGQDLVCAGASAVAFGAVNAIDAVCQVQLDVEMANDGGFLRCGVPNEIGNQAYENVQLLLEGMVVSLQTIEEQYGEYITIHG
ncbi:ribosomal-processing cysteine protease Prp [Texcoconibacillus texcoconensis]|uniref:Ribosomal processing cysteine protease Prp n=1 Tax=Texcoconibacillus texcoconensis TaxID=1095777 RepID=A0A840QSU2_9BACI|nr:ribosomal-processing cysteine protease Prp [Texcoconibacillus texcoconensis]MBB5174378.1 hypothetical protein [Texcoconibacillus texcoconensis]